MRKESRVFFLGAGASVDAGIPMATQLLDRIRKVDPYAAGQYKFYKDPSDHSFLQIAIEAVLANKTWVSTADVNSYNIERLLSIAQMAGRLGLGIPYADGEMVEAGWFSNLLIEWMLEMIEAAMLSNLPSCYARFGKQLRSSDAIVTLNYDLVCEKYLAQRFQTVNYHLLGLADRPNETVRSKIDLLKLHGSLNWRRCTGIEGQQSCGGTFSFSEKSIPAGGYMRAMQCQCGKGVLRSFIVAPTPLKDQDDPSLLHIWRHATRHLLGASRLFIVGYSMPSYDVTVQNLLRLVIINNKQLRVCVVNPDKKKRCGTHLRLFPPAALNTSSRHLMRSLTAVFWKIRRVLFSSCYHFQSTALLDWSLASS